MIYATLALFGLFCLALFVRRMIFHTRPSDIQTIEAFAKKANLRLIVIERESRPLWHSMGALARFYRLIAESSHGTVRKIHVAINFGSDADNLHVLRDRKDDEMESSSIREGGRKPSITDIRWINYVQRAIEITVICIFLYGAVMYTDAPIRPCGEAAYCGKGGTSRSEAEFRAYNRWEITIVVTALLAIPSHFFLARYKRRKISQI